MVLRIKIESQFAMTGFIMLASRITTSPKIAKVNIKNMKVPVKITPIT